MHTRPAHDHAMHASPVRRFAQNASREASRCSSTRLRSISSRISRGRGMRCGGSLGQRFVVTRITPPICPVPHCVVASREFMNRISLIWLAVRFDNVPRSPYEMLSTYTRGLLVSPVTSVGLPSPRPVNICGRSFWMIWSAFVASLARVEISDWSITSGLRDGARAVPPLAEPLPDTPLTATPLAFVLPPPPPDAQPQPTVATSAATTTRVRISSPSGCDARTLPTLVPRHCDAFRLRHGGLRFTLTLGMPAR